MTKIVVTLMGICRLTSLIYTDYCYFSQVGTLSRFADIKILRPGRMTYMYTLPPFMNEVLSKERQLMK